MTCALPPATSAENVHEGSFAGVVSDALVEMVTPVVAEWVVLVSADPPRLIVRWTGVVVAESSAAGIWNVAEVCRTRFGSPASTVATASLPVLLMVVVAVLATDDI